MLPFVPFGKSLAALDGRFAKYILLPVSQSKMDDRPALTGLRSSSPVESRLSRARDDPCSFRTRLIDPMAADVDADIAFESTDMLDGDDLKFDDTQCISVSRSMGKFQAMPGVPTLQHCESEQTHDNGIAKELGPRLYSAPADMVSPEQDEQPEPAESSAINACKPIIASVDGHLNRPVIHKTLSDPTAAYRTVLIRDKDDDDEGKDDDDSMEAMNMPFWYLPLKRQKPHAHHAGDSVPDDDMSIISDASLIPTYYPSDIMRHQQRPQHRAFIKRVIRAKAKAAKQTMRELKRSCRDAVEHVFVEPAASHKAPKCVAVGSAY